MYSGHRPTIEMEATATQDDSLSALINTNSESSSLLPVSVVPPLQPLSLLDIHQNRLAPFNPTCEHAQKVGIRLLRLQDDDVLFDLGCGDGRVLVSAVAAVSQQQQQQGGLRCVGIELDATFVAKARTLVTQLPLCVQQRIDIRHGDVLLAFQGEDEEDEQISTGSEIANKWQDQQLSNSINIGSICRGLTLRRDCTAIYLYLLPKGLLRIQPLLDQIVIERRRHATTTAAPVLRVVTYMFQMHGWTATSVDRTSKAGAPVYLYEL